MSTQHTSAGTPGGSTGDGAHEHTAGAFDIRTFIGTLLAIYGVILTVTGLVGDPQLDKTGGVNANLWAGLALLVVGLGFVGWAKARPVVVDERAVEAARREADQHPGH